MNKVDDDSTMPGVSSKGPGYLGQEIMGCQFSIYPLRQDDLGPAVRDAIEAAQAEGTEARVANLSTLLTGSEDQVFRALRRRTAPRSATARP